MEGRTRQSAPSTSPVHLGRSNGSNGFRIPRTLLSVEKFVDGLRWYLGLYSGLRCLEDLYLLDLAKANIGCGQRLIRRLAYIQPGELHCHSRVLIRQRLPMRVNHMASALPGKHSTTFGWCSW